MDKVPLRTALYFQIIVLAVKALVFPAYRSTDFEVHRNWLAITHSLPLSKWYTESTSQWTLDYPPLFAWFEYALASVAGLIDPLMLNVASLQYSSYKTVLFQRTSVIVTEMLLFYGAFCLVNTMSLSLQRKWTVLALICCSPGIFIVDNIHFQYNGLMYGIQLLSIAALARGKLVYGAVCFAVVLNFKHIYLYQALPYFVYLLSSCFKNGNFMVSKFLCLGSAVAVVFAISFGPFITQLPQILVRLFPFKRGICHSYWAPNLWAVYSFCDRVLLKCRPFN